MDFLWSKPAAIKDFPPYDETRNWRKEVFSASLFLSSTHAYTHILSGFENERCHFGFPNFCNIFFTPLSSFQGNIRREYAWKKSLDRQVNSKKNLMKQLLHKSASIESVFTAVEETKVE